MIVVFLPLRHCFVELLLDFEGNCRGRHERAFVLLVGGSKTMLTVEQA
jgi:hypothetical protein